LAVLIKKNLKHAVARIMEMKTLLGLFLAAALLLAPLAGPAQAEKVDLGKLTCGQFLEIDNEQELAYLFFWLDGYVSGKTGNTVLDPNTVEEDLKALVEMCQGKKNTPLLKALGK
jgi:acid stress chaperone HdeB